MTIHDSKAAEYARFCIDPDNKYVPRYVKKQAKRWLDIVDGKSPDNSTANTTGFANAAGIKKMTMS